MDELGDNEQIDRDTSYITTENEAINGQMVSALMIMDDQRWDIDLRKDIFDDSDANLVVVVPLHTNEVDMWFWRKEKLVSYSVKSAYTPVQEK